MSSSLSFYKEAPITGCRVDTMPNTTQVGPGVWVRGSSEQKTSDGLIYRKGGMTVVDSERGLSIAQMRPFLGPEYYNGGCLSIYANNSVQTPQSKPHSVSPETQQMYTDLFHSPLEPFTGNSAPPQCAGAKGVNYNTYLGWETSGNKLNFEKTEQNQPKTDPMAQVVTYKKNNSPCAIM